MFGIEYSLTQPGGDPLPFAPWFASAPDARIHGVDVRMREGEGRATYVPMNAADPRRLQQDVLAMPAPNCCSWSPATRGSSSVVEAAWDEPIFPGVFSPMAVTWKTFGGVATHGLTIRLHEVRHRIAIPDRVDHGSFWPAIRDELEKYCAFSAVGVKLTLLRAKPMGWPEGALRVARARLLFEFGGFNLNDKEALEDAAHYKDIPAEAFARLLE